MPLSGWVIQLFFMQLNEIELWLDMQLSPIIAKWIQQHFSVKAISSYDLFINDEKDEVIFLNAKKKENVILVSKDQDFVDLIDRFNPPPKLIWLTMGNCPNSQMKIILQDTLMPAINELIHTSTPIIEITK
jgi:predicted nuclease of predicted toxin-antitoxin system